MWLHSLNVAQLLRSAACLHTNQSRSYLNHLVFKSHLSCSEILYSVDWQLVISTVLTSQNTEHLIFNAVETTNHAFLNHIRGILLIFILLFL